MNTRNLAIPLYGKMSARSYHSRQFTDALSHLGLAPKYFVAPVYFKGGNLDRDTYFTLQTDRYDEFIKEHGLLKLFKEIRRFAVRTETTDLRLRERIESMLFDEKPVSRAWTFALALDALRRVPAVDRLACWSESNLYHTDFHNDEIKARQIKGVLTPGMGGHGFYNECLFAREARSLGLPVFASITNYDNLVNMGFRGYIPDTIGVWSKMMADEAVRLQKIPASRIEITGPVQFDRYFKPLEMGRGEFLKSVGLDPSKKTIMYAGGVNVSRYFEMYRLLLDPKHSKVAGRYNVIVRVYPHQKLLGSSGWQTLEELLEQQSCVYISNSLKQSSDSIKDGATEGHDELHCLLRYSDVMINYFSTISLEAALCDLPTIHVGYDDYTFGQLYAVSTAFQRRQTHNKRKQRLAAARVTSNDNEVLKYIEEFMADRSLQRDERREYALAECGFLDGKSSERLAAMIASRLKG